MLRANDLIWSFVVNNYLMGKDPLPFDLLFWNSDQTRMPAAMHLYYLRNMYQENLLVQPGGLVLDNVPLDLGKVKIPVYVQSGKEDHIAPAARSTRRPDVRRPGPFMLAGSGHIAGVINPPGEEVSALAERGAARQPWRNGRRARWNIPAHGGTIGASGCRRNPAPWLPREFPARADCRRSRMRRAVTSKYG